MSNPRTAAEFDLMVQAGGTLFLRAPELAGELGRLQAARAGGKAIVVLPDWEVYPVGEGYLLVLKLQFNLPATSYLAFTQEHYPRLREVIRADRFFLHADIPESTLRQTASQGAGRAEARAVVKQRAFLVNGLADGLIQLAYTLRQAPWNTIAALSSLEQALPRVRPKAAVAGGTGVSGA